MQKLHDEGIESVVTITLGNKDKQKRYYLLRLVMVRVSGVIIRIIRPGASIPIMRPGYTEVNTSYVFETNLYDVNNNQLIYSAESKTADARQYVNAADDYARSVVRDMKKKNVLG